MHTKYCMWRMYLEPTGATVTTHASLISEPQRLVEFHWSANLPGGDRLRMWRPWLHSMWPAMSKADMKRSHGIFNYWRDTASDCPTANVKPPRYPQQLLCTASIEKNGRIDRTQRRHRPLQRASSWSFGARICTFDYRNDIIPTLK
jgi:hypothetical protein